MRRRVDWPKAVGETMGVALLIAALLGALVLLTPNSTGVTDEQMAVGLGQAPDLPPPTTQPLAPALRIPGDSPRQMSLEPGTVVTLRDSTKCVVSRGQVASFDDGTVAPMNCSNAKTGVAMLPVLWTDGTMSVVLGVDEHTSAPEPIYFRSRFVAQRQVGVASIGDR